MNTPFVTREYAADMDNVYELQPDQGVQGILRAQVHRHQDV